MYHMVLAISDFDSMNSKEAILDLLNVHVWETAFVRQME